MLSLAMMMVANKVKDAVRMILVVRMKMVLVMVLLVDLTPVVRGHP